MQKNIKSSLIYLLVLSSCANQEYQDYLETKKIVKVKNSNYCLTELNSNAKKIKIKYLAEEKLNLAQCDFLKNIETDYCSSPDWLHPGSINHLKNQVAELSGDTLAIETPPTPNKYQRVGAMAYNCSGKF